MKAKELENLVIDLKRKGHIDFPLSDETVDALFERGRPEKVSPYFANELLLRMKKSYDSQKRLERKLKAYWNFAKLGEYVDCYRRYRGVALWALADEVECGVKELEDYLSGQVPTIKVAPQYVARICCHLKISFERILEILRNEFFMEKHAPKVAVYARSGGSRHMIEAQNRLLRALARDKHFDLASDPDFSRYVSELKRLMDEGDQV